LLTLNSSVARSKKITWKVIEGKGILLNPQEAEIIQLDEVGLEIWNSIGIKRKISEIIDHIVTTFQVSKRRATKDVLGFLKKLQGFGVIKEV